MEETQHLYAVYLGGDPAQGRLGEDHEVVFVVASDVRAARSKAKDKWKGVNPPHVDAVRELDVIDGFEIVLASSSEDETPKIDTTYVSADVLR